MIPFTPPNRTNRNQHCSSNYPSSGQITMGDERADIAERVKHITVEQLTIEKSKVIDAASIVDDLGADSLEVVQIVMLIEDEFGIAIPDRPAEVFLTVRALLISWSPSNRQGTRPPASLTLLALLRLLLSRLRLSGVAGFYLLKRNQFLRCLIPENEPYATQAFLDRNASEIAQFGMVAQDFRKPVEGNAAR
jgi:acyl carrier protein